MSETAPRKETHTANTTPHSDAVQVTDAIRNAGHGFVFTSVRDAGKPTPRMKRVARNSGVRWVLETSKIQNLRQVWTPAQYEAIALVYGAGRTVTEAARELGISKQSLDERLRNAERAARNTKARLRRKSRKKGRTGQPKPFHEAI